MTASARPRTRAKAMAQRREQALVAARSTPGAVEQATIRRDAYKALAVALHAEPNPVVRLDWWLVEHFLPALDGVGLEIVRKR